MNQAPNSVCFIWYTYIWDISLSINIHLISDFSPSLIVLFLFRSLSPTAWKSCWSVLGDICPDNRVTFQSDGHKIQIWFVLLMNFLVPAKLCHFVFNHLKLCSTDTTISNSLNIPYFTLLSIYMSFASLSNILGLFVQLVKSYHHLKPSSLVWTFGKLFLTFFSTSVKWRPLLLLLSHSIIVTYSQVFLPFYTPSSMRLSSGPYSLQDPLSQWMAQTRH